MTTTSAVLFPVPPSHILTGFTTSSTPIQLPQITHVHLSDKELGVHKVASRFSHAVVPPPVADAAHTHAWEAVFVQGSIAPGNKDLPPGGFGFYMRGPKAFHEQLATTGGQEVVMSYEVLFEDGWEWQKGGKLPGICKLFSRSISLQASLKYDSPKMAVSVSSRVDAPAGDRSSDASASIFGSCGGAQHTSCRRILTEDRREGGAGELYAYVPLNDENVAALKAVPNSHQNSDYGFSVGRGLWTFESGQWTAVAERVKMNTVGQADGTSGIVLAF